MTQISSSTYLWLRAFNFVYSQFIFSSRIERSPSKIERTESMLDARYRCAAMVLLAAASAVILQSLPSAFAQNSTSISTQNMIKPIKYPAARKSDQVDDYHGVKVADPYRWLADLESQETAHWVEEENNLSFGFLNEIPARNSLKERLTKLWNYEKFG